MKVKLACVCKFPSLYIQMNKAQESGTVYNTDRNYLAAVQLMDLICFRPSDHNKIKETSFTQKSKKNTSARGVLNIAVVYT